MIKPFLPCITPCDVPVCVIDHMSLPLKTDILQSSRRKYAAAI